jgi:glycosyltransferase involved in cell wall biosynthesis
LFVGRISPEKGIHLLLEAFAKVHEADPNVVLDLVGHYAPAPFELLVGVSEDQRVRDLAVFYDPSKGSYMDQVKALIPPSMTEKVRFRGGVPYTEIVEEYRKADIFVNASYSEGFCLPVVEATGYGLPVVAARAGGNAEMVVDGETGFVFEIGDEQALASAMLSLVQDGSLREQMGKAGRQRVLEAFSYDAIVNKMEATYKGLL